MSKYMTRANTVNIGGMILEQVEEMHDGWDTIDETTNSGKQMFQCKSCLRRSVHPDKWCPVGPARKVGGPDRVVFTR